jgi:hypothetical protein
MNLSLVTNTGNAVTRFTRTWVRGYPTSAFPSVFTLAENCGILAAREIAT